MQEAQHQGDGAKTAKLKLHSPTSADYLSQSAAAVQRNSRDLGVDMFKQVVMQTRLTDGHSCKTGQVGSET